MTTAIKTIKSGYKQTELGVIPEDWSVTTLLNITVDGITNGVFNDPAKVGRGYRLINVLDLYHGYNIDTKKLSRLELPPADFAKKKVKKGDLFFTRSSITPDGIAFCNFCDEDAEDITFDGHIMKITPNANVVNSAFLRLYCISEAARKYLISSAKQTTMTTIGQSELAQLPIPLPSLPEQAAIANVFSDTDVLIELLDKLIAKKRDIKQATMQQLLTGKTRLPGFSRDWMVVKLEDIADKNIRWSITGGPFGSNLKAVDYTVEGVRIIQLQNIGDGIFHDEYKIYTSEEKADELISCNIYPGEIILSKMGDPVARACIVPNSDHRYLMASDGIRLVVNEKRFDKRFVHDYINSIYFRKRTIEASTGSTRQRIGLEDLRKLPIVVPPLSEQHAIETILSDMNAEIAALEQKRDKTKALKQGMMQELLTGKTRLI